MSDIKIGLIGGSGLGEALGSQEAGTRHEVQTPFGPPSDAILETNWGGVPVFVLSRHGPGHLLNPSQVPYRANIFALKKLGVTHIIASGAVGSLREQFRPRDLVIPDQIIDKTCTRAATFFDYAAVHVEFAEPFCPVLRRILVEAGEEDAGTRGRGDAGREGEAPVVGGESAESEGRAPEAVASSVAPSPRPLVPASPRPPLPAFTTHSRGCYVAMEGPAFSTRAESLMHRLWGGDLIGMTAMPEAKLAREAEIPYALVALVTDYDCWRKAAPANPGSAAPAAQQADPAELLKEIIANLRAASDNGIALMRRAVERIAREPQALAACPARDALTLAIWSDKARIPREQVELLAPLWMRYFEGL
ncbi:MAG TPA: MTAP family purine nucleoside phosphorylase [Tepidisphaeraceae bacterium]|jgi:5'-methylthioadenosine phosphorylase|nr:MTAP family purine nucleoside phosphorylase [Tepidisphaeraceae bacterium]